MEEEEEEEEGEECRARVRAAMPRRIPSITASRYSLSPLNFFSTNILLDKLSVIEWNNDKED